MDFEFVNIIFRRTKLNWKIKFEKIKSSLFHYSIEMEISFWISSPLNVFRELFAL